MNTIYLITQTYRILPIGRAGVFCLHIASYDCFGHGYIYEPSTIGREKMTGIVTEIVGLLYGATCPFINLLN
jgi:hypothetical protein